MLISIDLETTGLNPALDQILEIGAVAVDKGEIVKTFRAVNQANRFSGDPFALALNQHLFKEISSKEKKGETLYGPLNVIISTFGNWLENLGPKHVATGKNFAGFDLPFLKAAGFDSAKYFSHRSIDPGSLYCKPWEIPPSLTDCLKLIGETPTDLHTAVGDALDVVKLVKYYWDNNSTR